MQEQRFHTLTNQYFNYGYINRTDKLISLISQKYVINKNSELINEQWNLNSVNESNSASAPDKITIKGLEIISPQIGELKNFYINHLSKYAMAAIIHGSVATGEIINYSDFDGLLILKNDVFKNKSAIAEAAHLINRSYALMLKFDPLQHHGWMILTENDLLNWPAGWFPPELFNYSRSLNGTELHLNIQMENKVTDYKSIFLQNANRVIKSVEKNGLPDQGFGLKSILSEFMLLPTLYVTAREGHGIFKKFSFDEARVDFSKTEWSVMDQISEIRNSWPDFKKQLSFDGLKNVNLLTRRKQISESKLPDSLIKMITPEMPQSMIKFTKLMISKIS